MDRSQIGRTEDGSPIPISRSFGSVLLIREIAERFGASATHAIKRVYRRSSRSVTSSYGKFDKERLGNARLIDRDCHRGKTSPAFWRGQREISIATDVVSFSSFLFIKENELLELPSR